MYDGAAVATRDDAEPKPMSFIRQLKCLNLVLMWGLDRAKKKAEGMIISVPDIRGI